MTGIIIDDFVATPVTTTSAPVVFPLVYVDALVVVFQEVSEHGAPWWCASNGS